MLKLPRSGDPELVEWAAVLNAELLRREPRILSSVYDCLKWYVRWLAPYSCPWVQVHLQSTAVGEGDLTYDADNYTSSTLVHCNQERMQDFEATLEWEYAYSLFLIPVQYDGEDNKILYDGVSAEDRKVALTLCCQPGFDKFFMFAKIGLDEITEATAGTGITISSDIGFHGATPISQQSKIADATGGATQDAEARVAINAVLAVLRSYGLIAPS